MLNFLSILRSGDYATVVFYVVVLLMRLPALILALSVHEASHAFVAYRLGDPTARNLGRLTLNPIKHLDLFGTIAMIVFGIGWAKPVPVNSRYFKKPKWGMALTAAAGPLSNLLLSVIGVIALFSFTRLMMLNGKIAGDYAYYRAAYGGSLYYVLQSLYLNMLINYGLLYKLAAIFGFFLFVFTILNVSLAIFNLLPVPPFDGSRVLFVFLPDRAYFAVMKYERFIMIGLMILLMLGAGSSILGFLMNGASSLLFRAFSFILRI